MNNITEVISRLETEDVSIGVVIQHPTAPAITFVSSVAKGGYTQETLNKWVSEAGSMAIEAAVEQVPEQYGAYMREGGETLDVIL